MILISFHCKKETQLMNFVMDLQVCSNQKQVLIFLGFLFRSKAITLFFDVGLCLSDAVVGAAKQHKKNLADVEGRDRKALGDIGNLVPEIVKPNRPITRFFLSSFSLTLSLSLTHSLIF